MLSSISSTQTYTEWGISSFVFKNTFSRIISLILKKISCFV